MTGLSLAYPPEASPVELVEAALERVERTQRRDNAFTVVLADDARARARALEQTPSPGPLHGLPVVVKDLFDVAGVTTTGCCAAYAGRPPAGRDADIVRILRDAGAVVVAKTNQHELGFGATGVVSAAGPVRNPLDPGVLCGGSSGGSAAAVAAGCVRLAIGTDTGGSIRMPASFCGIVGLKPTPGALSLRGAMAMSPALDAGGPMTATVAECAAAWSVLAPHPDPAAFPGAPGPARPEPIRVGLSPSMFRLVHAETRRAVEQAAAALEAAGAVVVDVPAVELLEDGDAFSFVWADAALVHAAITGDDRVHPEVAALLRKGASMSGLDYARSLEAAREIRVSFRRALDRADVLLAPATPYPAPPIAAEEVEVVGGAVDVHRGGPARLTAPVNLAGLPALAFPVGRTSTGLPIGAQLIGRPWSEPLLLERGLAYEERVPSG